MLSAIAVPGCPFVHTIHFPKDAFSWTHAAKGGTSSADEALSEGPAPPLSEAQLESFVIPSKPWKTRFRCRSCGACVMSTNAKTGSCSVWGAHLARDADGRILGWDGVQPTAHIFYGTRMLDVADGLGKWEGYEARSARVD